MFGRGGNVPCSNGDELDWRHVLSRAGNPLWTGDSTEVTFASDPAMAETALEIWQRDYLSNQVKAAKETGAAEERERHSPTVPLKPEKKKR